MSLISATVLKKVVYTVFLLALMAWVGVGVLRLVSQPNSSLRPPKLETSLPQGTSLPKELTQNLPDSLVVSGKLETAGDNMVVIRDRDGEEGEYRFCDDIKIYCLDREVPGRMRETGREDLKVGEEMRLTMEREGAAYCVNQIVAGD